MVELVEGRLVLVSFCSAGVHNCLYLIENTDVLEYYKYTFVYVSLLLLLYMSIWYYIYYSFLALL